MKYITVLSTDAYLVGVLALHKSLEQVDSKYGLIALINENISEKTKKILRKNDIETVKMESFKIPKWLKEKNENNSNWKYWSYTFDKFRVFELTQYDKLVYLDCDMYIKNNIDELFQKPNMSAVVDRHIGIEIKDDYQKLTSGLMVIEPKKGIISEFKKILNDIKLREIKNNIGDQDIIQLYDTEWENKKELHLPVKYNMFFIGIDYYINKNYYTLDELSVIHFTKYNKPWNYSKENINTEYLKWITNELKKGYEKNKLKDEKENIEFGNKYREIILREYSKILCECMDEIENYKYD